jgi:hypothetical protein
VFQVSANWTFGLACHLDDSAHITGKPEVIGASPTVLFADHPAIDHALKQRDVINFVCAADRYEERAAPIPIIGFAVLVSGGQDSSAFCR